VDVISSMLLTYLRHTCYFLSEGQTAEAAEP